MNALAQRCSRRAVIGAAAGIPASVLLAASCGPNAAIGLFVGMIWSVLYSLTVRPPRDSGAYLDGALTAAVLGVPLWGAFNVVALPFFHGAAPQWTADGMRAQLPSMAGWMLAGVILGLLAPAGQCLASRLLGPEPQDSESEDAKPRQRIVIVGGGFAGVGVAQELERLFGTDPGVDLTLVSETNALLFTPMLTEVAASSLEPTHISSPLRTSLRRTSVVRAKVTGFDAQKRVVNVERKDTDSDGAFENDALPYDHLVLALGAVTNFLGNDAVRDHSLDFKSLADAIRVRNRVIDAFDRADAETDAERRRALLTFVIAGGGFSGAELAGALNDFTRGILADYPHLAPNDVRVIVVHSRDRILPELSEGLAGYALDRMKDRGVTFQLNARVIDAAPGRVTVQEHGGQPTEIRAGTLIWTAGAAPSPTLRDLPCDHDKRGAVIAESTMAVKGMANVWALGDCASIPDAKSGQPCPGTAQFAVRQAPRLARNIYATINGRAPVGFHFNALGTLCVVGHQTACAEIRGLRFSGFLAWVMWRAIYWMKLPGMERKVRVLSDWAIEIFFPRDIVQTLDIDDRRATPPLASSPAAS